MRKKIKLNSKVFLLKSNGFTLIELLAVIVILAIISIIAVPIVLNIINDSKDSSLIQSAQFYIDSLENKIMQENMRVGGTLNPKECIVDASGNVNCDGSYLEIDLKGNKPTSGTITMNNGKIIKVNLTIENEIITMNNSGELQLGDSITICRLIFGTKNEIGSKYSCEVKKGTNFYFYILSHESDGTTNLIMDRNICDDGAAARSDRTCLVSWNSTGNNTGGPVTAMTYLTNATSTWDNIDNLNITYDDEDPNRNFVGFAITGKARLPRFDEIYGNDKCLTKEANNNEYGSCPAWLVDNLNIYDYYTNNEPNKKNINGIWGYWTLSSYSGVANSAWHVHYYGDVGGYSVNLDDHLGVRPVINVKL